MKNVLTIQDISCVGKCSVTVALPILSAMGIETSILPTAVLSTHTKFSHVHVHDMTDELEAIMQQWEAEHIRFDIIYIGYLGSVKQIEIMKSYIRKQRELGAYIVLDPVMGDNGKLYRGFTNDYVMAMRGLCQYADLLLPNMTEVALLTQLSFEEVLQEGNQEKLIMALDKLQIDNILLTGMKTTEQEIFVGYYQRDQKTIELFKTDKIQAQYHGTGDIFASVCTGAIARGMSISEGVELAMDYVTKTMQVTQKEQKDDRYGVLFEKTIVYLIQKIHEINKT